MYSIRHRHWIGPAQLQKHTVRHNQCITRSATHGSKIKITIPVNKKALQPHTQTNMQAKLKQWQATQKYYYDKKIDKEHRPLNIGDTVKYRNHEGKWTPGTIIKADGWTDREYRLVNQKKNPTITRNKTHIIKAPVDEYLTEIAPNTITHDPDTATTPKVNQMIDTATEQEQDQQTINNNENADPPIRVSSFGRIIRPVLWLDL